MFADAYEMAIGYTRPVVISILKRDGKCTSGVGSFIVINDAGWFVTAAHMVQQLTILQKQVAAAKLYDAELARLASSGLNHKQRRDAMKSVSDGKDAPTRFSAWWSGDGIEISDVSLLASCDLAVGRLSSLPAGVSFPRFKDPAKPMRYGTSLCRVGFPFAEVTPIFHANIGAFELPAGTSLSFFPIEGIFTRHVDVLPHPKAPPFPERYIETSSPGLRGQSGGPIFDARGTVWAIQSQTQHLELGFNATPAGQKTPVHQFLNVGWGASVETLVPLLRQLKIDHQLADY